MSYTYLQELEHLILETLLPVYIDKQKASGCRNPYYGINQDLLDKIIAKKKLPALFRPKETQT